MIAAILGDYEMSVASLVSASSAKLNAVTSNLKGFACDHFTPLGLACLLGRTTSVRSLLNAGADPCLRVKSSLKLIREGEEVVVSGEFAPAYLAVQAGNIDALAVILSFAPAELNRVSVCDQATSTPLFMAAQEGRLEVVQALLEHKALIDVAQSDTGATPLSTATHFGHLEVVRTLVEAGADVNQCRTDDGASPLFTASDMNRLEVRHPLTCICICTLIKRLFVQIGAVCSVAF